MKQRILLLTLGLALWVSVLWAKPRSEMQARLIAEQCASQMISSSQLNQLRSAGKPWLTLVSAPAEGADMVTARSTTQIPVTLPIVTAYYVYNIGVRDGYVMVSGDDLLPELIAYADEGSFLPDAEQPEHIASFLAEVRGALHYLVERGKPIVTPRTSQLRPEGVQPLLGNIAWGQGYPFNTLCPVKKGENSVVGCVATAISQIMRYHEWPTQGEGVCAYTEQDGTKHRVDFSQYTYDWRNMPDIPLEYAPNKERKALSLLCYHVGVVSQMQYSPEGSGTYSQFPKEGLYKHFKYKKDLQLLTRMNYKMAEWMDIIAREINAGRPVYYAGASKSVGHAFVCDGYDNRGYYHINLGWNGMANGYFLLYAINPSRLGTGGGTSYDGYNNLQEIIVGIEPDRDGSSARTVSEEISAHTVSVSYDDNGHINLEEASLQLTSATNYKTRFCLSITPTDDDTKIYYGDKTPEQDIQYHVAYIYSKKELYKIPSISLQDLGLPTRSASYTVTLAYEGMNGQMLPVRHYNGGSSKVLISFDDKGRVSYSDPIAEPLLELTKVIDPKIRGFNPSTMTLRISNLSKEEEYYASWTCYFEDMKGERMPLTTFATMMLPNQQQEIPLKIMRHRIPTGTRGNILLSGEYDDYAGNPTTYTIRSRQPIEVLPSNEKVYKLATMECVARRSLSGAIEYAPGVTTAIPFEITNLGELIRDNMYVLWNLFVVLPNGEWAQLAKTESRSLISLKKEETIQYNIDASGWNIEEGKQYYLTAHLYELIEQGGSYFLGPLERDITLPVVYTPVPSSKIDENLYISLEKVATQPYTLSVQASTPSMIRINGLDISRTSKSNDTFSIEGRANRGRTAIIGNCTSLVITQPESTGIVEADFSHASPDLQHISLCHSQIKGQAMTEMIRSLPDRAKRERGTIALVDTSRPDLEGNVCTAEQVEMAARRGWTVTDHKGGAYAAVDTPVEREYSEWTLYPTPVRDQLTVIGLPIGSAITLYSLQGKQLLQAVIPASGQLQLSLATMPDGTYILSTTLGSRRVIVAH